MSIDNEMLHFFVNPGEIPTHVHTEAWLKMFTATLFIIVIKYETSKCFPARLGMVK